MFLKFRILKIWFDRFFQIPARQQQNFRRQLPDYGLDEEPEPELVKKEEKPKPKKTVHLAVQEEDKQVSALLHVF